MIHTGDTELLVIKELMRAQANFIEDSGGWYSLEFHKLLMKYLVQYDEVIQDIDNDECEECSCKCKCKCSKCSK